MNANANSVEVSVALVAFGSWRCNCTMLAATREEIPGRCPAHGAGLLDRPSIETNPHNVPLGYAEAA